MQIESRRHQEENHTLTDCEAFRRKVNIECFAMKRKKEDSHSARVTGASLKIFWELVAESSLWHLQCAEGLLLWGRMQAIQKGLACPALGSALFLSKVWVSRSYSVTFQEVTTVTFPTLGTASVALLCSCLCCIALHDICSTR